MLSRSAGTPRAHGLLALRQNPGTLAALSLPLVLALVDALVGLYLLIALRRQSRNREALPVTAVSLLLASAALAVLGLLPLPGEGAGGQ